MLGKFSTFHAGLNLTKTPSVKELTARPLLQGSGRKESILDCRAAKFGRQSLPARSSGGFVHNAKCQLRAGFLPSLHAEGSEITLPALELLRTSGLPAVLFGGSESRQKGEFAMNLKRVLMLAVFAAIALPGAAHAQVRFGVAIGGPYRSFYYRPGVRVAIGLPPVAIGFGAPVYVQPAPVYYAAPIYPAPVVYATPTSPVYVAQPQLVAQPNGYPALPPQPVPVPIR